MNPSDFWKNFRLGEEVHIAGSFIYNGLRRFHELEIFDFSDEVFECFYNLAVGIERILKIAIVLCEHTETTDQEELEQSLITHNHLDLLARLRKHEKQVNLGKPQIELLQLLSVFYKTLRYDRFSLNSAYVGQKEANAILDLLSRHLNVEITASPLGGTANDDRYRAFIRRTVLKISQVVYDIIDRRATALGLYTYELRYESKAASVFLRQVDIAHEDVLWKELLIFFMNSKAQTAYFEFIREMKPLKFDPGLISDYLACFKSDPPNSVVMDELEHHYEEMGREERKLRLQRIQVIGESGLHFEKLSEYDDDFDEDDPR